MTTGECVKLEAEHYTLDGQDIANETPLTIPPYTGVAYKIAGYSKSWALFPKEMTIRVTLRDVFGKPVLIDVPVVNRYARVTGEP